MYIDLSPKKEESLFLLEASPLVSLLRNMDHLS